MSTIIHTIRVIDKAADRCHVIYGTNQQDVIDRAKDATANADYYEIETWRINGKDPEAEHGTMLTTKTVTTL